MGKKITPVRAALFLLAGLAIIGGFVFPSAAHAQTYTYVGPQLYRAGTSTIPPCLPAIGGITATVTVVGGSVTSAVEPFTVPDPRRCGIVTRLGCFR